MGRRGREGVDWILVNPYWPEAKFDFAQPNPASKRLCRDEET